MAYISPFILRKSLVAFSAMTLALAAVPMASAATSAAPAPAKTADVKVAQNSAWGGQRGDRGSRSGNRGNGAGNNGNRTRDRDHRTNDRRGNNHRSNDHRRRDSRPVVRRRSNGHNSHRRHHVQPRHAVRHRPVIQHRSHNNRRAYKPYRSHLGINLSFGSPGYSSFRWAPTPYSFYNASYGGYNGYRSRTVCRRVNVEAWRFGNRELVSVEQCSNPWDGTYYVQGSERLIARRW